jgi:hypothetical protein
MNLWEIKYHNVTKKEGRVNNGRLKANKEQNSDEK